MSALTKPIAVLISDIHFTTSTLELASKSLRMAQYKALTLKVPLIICGDTLDTKCIIRAECANALIDALNKVDAPKTYVLVGNHDLLNEKSNGHSLNFLRPYCNVIDSLTEIMLGSKDVVLIPYQSDSDKISCLLLDERLPKTIIMHQGVQTAKMGHYVQDKTSLPPEAFDGFRVISGHYHARQTIKCGTTGSFSYVGNPYTLGFGEANDPEKGFQVLNEDGSLTFVPTNLRKHKIFYRTTDEISDMMSRANDDPYSLKSLHGNDLIWLKISGPKSRLDLIEKEYVGQILLGHSNYKLEKIPTDSPEPLQNEEKLTDNQLLDAMIDASTESVEDKLAMKALWKELV